MRKSILAIAFVIVMVLGTLGIGQASGALNLLSATGGSSTVKFGMQLAVSPFTVLSGGSVTVDSVGTFPVDVASANGAGGTTNSIPDGTYTITAVPPSGYVVKAPTVTGYWMTSPNMGSDYGEVTTGPIWFSPAPQGYPPQYPGRNANPTTINLKGFSGIIWIYLAPGVYTPPTAGTISLSPTSVLEGQSVTVSGSGFSPNLQWNIQLSRTDGTMTQTEIMTTSSGSGSFQESIVPTYLSGVAPIGSYSIWAQGAGANSAAKSSQITLTVIGESSTTGSNPGLTPTSNLYINDVATANGASISVIAPVVFKAVITSSTPPVTGVRVLVDGVSYPMSNVGSNTFQSDSITLNATSSHLVSFQYATGTNSWGLLGIVSIGAAGYATYLNPTVLAIMVGMIIAVALIGYEWHKS